MLPVTAPYAGLLAILFLALSLRISLYRRTHRRSLGDEGDRDLLRLMRAQANCAEYAPLGIVLLAIAELQGAPAIGLHLLGLMLLAGRLLHAIGFSRKPQVLLMRQAGAALTYLILLFAGLGLVAHALV